MRGVRKLACLSIGYSLAVFAAHYILPKESLFIFAALLPALILPALFLNGNARLRAILLIVSASLGLLSYGLHYKNTIYRISELDGKTQKVTAELTAYPEEHDYGGKVRVKVLDGRAKGLKAAVYDYNGALPDDAAPGDILIAELKLRSAALRYGEESDADISLGVYLNATLMGETELTRHDGFSLKYVPQELARILQTKISELFPDDSRVFMLALMIGNKDEYYEDDSVNTAMSIAGLSHVVAVSGMHVSFLVAFLELILGKSRRTSILCLGFVWLFVLMSGSSPSAIRAGFMLSVALFAPIVNRENDRLTSLTFALCVILAVNPFAAGSVSLQLSFAAIAGIYAFGKKLFDYVSEHTPEMRRAKRLKLYVIGAFSNSVAVTAFTFPVMAARFGTVSLMSPVTNILCLWAVSLIFIGGYAVCFIGILSNAVAAFSAAVLSYLVRYIIWIVRLIAKIPFAQIYTDNLYALLWALLTYGLFAVYGVMRKKDNKQSLALPTILSVAALVSVFAWTRASVYRDTGTANILDVGNGLCIVLTEKEHAAVIDCGSAGTTLNAGTAASKLLKSHGRNSVDCLVLTHLHSDHARGAVRLIDTMDVKKLVLPKDAGANADEGILDEILDAASDNGVEVLYLDRDTMVSAGNIALDIKSPYSEGDRNERGLMLTASVGGKNILITGDVSESTERKLARDRDLSNTDVLIVGHHGSKYATSYELLNEAKPETAIISVGFNSYGHPSDEVLHKLDYFGIETYRTDISGKITITGD